MSTLPPDVQERREQRQIREIFELACKLLAPIVAGNDQARIVSNFAMTLMLKDHFPELTSAEAHIVISTVERMHQQDRLRSILDSQ
jgi:hypothetical protein